MYNVYRVVVVRPEAINDRLCDRTFTTYKEAHKWAHEELKKSEPSSFFRIYNIREVLVVSVYKPPNGAAAGTLGGGSPLNTVP
jgi:hypothetical protein